MIPDTQISTPFNIHQFVNDYEFRGDGGDHIPTDSERAMLEDAITGAIQAALAGHVVVPQVTQTEIVRICNSAEHDARYAARKLDGDPRQRSVEVLAATFKLIRAMIDAAPPVSRGE